MSISAFHELTLPPSPALLSLPPNHPTPCPPPPSPLPFPPTPKKEHKLMLGTRDLHSRYVVSVSAGAGTVGTDVPVVTPDLGIAVDPISGGRQLGLVHAPLHPGHHHIQQALHRLGHVLPRSPERSMRHEAGCHLRNNSMRHEAGCHQVETGNQLSCAHLKVRQPVYPERSMRHEAGRATWATRKVNEA